MVGWVLVTPAIHRVHHSIEWTEANSSIPLIGTASFFVEDGGMFAIGPSGFEQGEVAAKMAIRILDDEVVPSDIPVAMPQQFIVYMRRSTMVKRGIALPRMYESFARATGNYVE